MEQIDVRILDRDYKLAVSPDQRERLLEAVAMVDQRMRSLRDSGRVAGVDRIAVMVALQLANELLSASLPGSSAPTGEVIRRIRKMNEEIDAEIKRQERLF
ncbi:MAG TPA: cell division protein ZapA [Quisquiliibacterium sp.]|jgi:cell division protein ZapA|nr:cell division protein ZapA [Quisquiliibacterium sp.]